MEFSDDSCLCTSHSFSLFDFCQWWIMLGCNGGSAMRFMHARPISAFGDKLWTRLHKFSTGFQVPWTLVGDFNLL